MPAVESFQHPITGRASKFTFLALLRRQFESPEPSSARGTSNVALVHDCARLSACFLINTLTQVNVQAAFTRRKTWVGRVQIL
jgi:hypothetical protein